MNLAYNEHEIISDYATAAFLWWESGCALAAGRPAAGWPAGWLQAAGGACVVGRAIDARKQMPGGQRRRQRRLAWPAVWCGSTPCAPHPPVAFSPL